MTKIGVFILRKTPKICHSVPKNDKNCPYIPKGF